MYNYFKKPIKFFAQHWYKNRDALNIARQRIILAGGMAVFAYAIVAIRLVDIIIFKKNPVCLGACLKPEHNMRYNILDRNGEIIATQLITASIYANPQLIINPELAAKKLCSILKDLDYQQILKRLRSSKSFIWIARHIPPKIQYEINNLGIPGVYLQSDQCRVYPHGNLFSHILGGCDIDNNGIMGVEKQFNDSLLKEDLILSIDLRIQHVVHNELQNGITQFQASGGNVMVLDLKSGQILAMVSLPDYNPNLPNKNHKDTIFNRNTLGVYEPGSVFKTINMAIALESGSAKINTIFDATNPIKIGRFVVTDFKGQNRPLTMLEAFIYSSNIACIKIAQKFGNAAQKKFFKQFGLLEPIKLEIPENGIPIVPKLADWREVSTMTMSYGYGISVAPLQTFSTISGFINDGFKFTPTILHNKIPQAKRIISSRTSFLIRQMMRAVVTDGTAKKADVPGYQVFGKTGTAYQASHGNYGLVKKRNNTFVGGFPFHNPRFMLIVMLDDPKPSAATHGYATAGWNTAPIAGKIIARIAPLLGVKPVPEDLDHSLRANTPVSISLIQPSGD